MTFTKTKFFDGFATNSAVVYKNMLNKKMKLEMKNETLTLPLHVLCGESHGFPVSKHLGPAVFGETSPSLAWAKAATNLPFAYFKIRRFMNWVKLKF